MIIKTPKTDSQNYKVLEYLKDGNFLTCLEATEMGFTHNLRSRIADLKRMGYDIVVEYQKTKDSYIAVYSLKMTLKELVDRLYQIAKTNAACTDGGTLTTYDGPSYKLSDIIVSEFETRRAIKALRDGGYICPF